MTREKSEKNELETRVRTLELQVDALYKLLEIHTMSQVKHRCIDLDFPKPDPITGWKVT